jgi:hypothetical protein
VHRSVEIPGIVQATVTGSMRSSATPASSIASRVAHAAGSSPSTMPAMASSMLSRPAAYSTGARSWRTSIAVRALGS